MKLSKYTAVSLFFCCLMTRAESLYVFLPTEITATTIQNSLNTACNGLDVKVFGRSKDFRKEVAGSSPSAVLTMPPVISTLSQFTTNLVGEVNGQIDENYLLVSVDKQIKIDDVDKHKIGVIDILGRKPMSEYVEKLFGKPLKLKRVTKVEDLLPLLSFGAVSAILIPQSLLESIKSKSNLDLMVAPLPMKTGFASVAINSEKSVKDIQGCFASLAPSMNSMLGVDKWKQL